MRAQSKWLLPAVLLATACSEAPDAMPEPALAQLRLSLHIDGVPPEVETLHTEVLLDDQPLLPSRDDTVEQRDFEFSLPGEKLGKLSVSVDGEDFPELVRAEGRAELLLSGQTTATLTIPMTRSEACADGWCWLSPRPQASTFNRLLSTGPKDLWAAGDRGLLMRWDGRAWRRMRNNPVGTQGISELWASGPRDVWLFHSYSSRAFRFDGTDFQEVPAPAFPVRRAWGNSAALWTVGRSGKVARWNGASWQELPSGITDDLWGVWGIDERRVWMVGDRGTIV